MELDKAERLAVRLMKKHGIYPEWSFRYDKSKTRHGQARTVTIRGREVKEITLSRHITERSSPKSVRDTILHEIAHVLVGLEQGHNEIWEIKAREIGSIGKDFTEHDLAVVESLKPYSYVCENGHPVMRSIRPLSTHNIVCSKDNLSVYRLFEGCPEVVVRTTP